MPTENCKMTVKLVNGLLDRTNKFAGFRVQTAHTLLPWRLSNFAGIVVACCFSPMGLVSIIHLANRFSGATGAHIQDKNSCTLVTWMTELTQTSGRITKILLTNNRKDHLAQTHSIYLLITQMAQQQYVVWNQKPDPYDHMLHNLFASDTWYLLSHSMITKKGCNTMKSDSG
jgi:hypothetical protein